MGATETPGPDEVLASPPRPALSGRRLVTTLIGLGVGILLCAAIGYGRFIDWPSLKGTAEVRSYLPDPYPLEQAHYYRYRNFMDTWDLYRFVTSRDGIDHLAAELHLSPVGLVYEFPLIVSRPPPYWWHPEELPVAEIYRSDERAADGRLYELLYSAETGITYMIRFDG